MRAIWSGSLSFGLVNIPVKLYSGEKREELSFNFLHKDDLSPIRYAKICKFEEKEVSQEEIVRGYEYSKGSYVVITDEDFEKANIRLTKTITVLDFVNKKEIDSIYFEKPYYLEPDDGSQKPYSLLREALKRSQKVGIGRYVLRNKEHLVLLKSEDKGLVLEQLRFPEEIREINELNLPVEEKVDEKEMQIALNLIGQLTKKFNPDEYSDTYKRELKRIIKEKVEGKIPTIKGEVPTPTPVPDLMEMLKKSLNEEKKKKEKLTAKSL